MTSRKWFLQHIYARTLYFWNPVLKKLRIPDGTTKGALAVELEELYSSLSKESDISIFTQVMLPEWRKKRGV